jgi:hypothetical protein
MFSEQDLSSATKICIVCFCINILKEETGKKRKKAMKSFATVD